MRILEQLRQRFLDGLEGWVERPDEHAQRLTVSREAKLGDYQANLAMGLAKSMGKPPREIAEEVIARVRLGDLCEQVEVAGNGFINLRLSHTFLAECLKGMGSRPNLGIDAVASPRTYVVDFSSPNVAKPMHVGHIRSTVIGDAITRILRALGHRVVTDNHLGDWGTQFGMILLGYKHFRDEGAYRVNPVAELSRLYRVIHALIGYQEALKKVGPQKQLVEMKSQLVAQAKAKSAAAPQDKSLSKQVQAAERSYREVVEELAKLEQTIAGIEGDTESVKRAAAHPDLASQALAETAKLHAGDVENLALWKEFLPHCLDEIHHIYDRLQIRFDHEFGESFYHDQLAPVVKDLESRGLAVDSDGAVCVFLEGFDAPMIVRKKDGAFLYATTDLATVAYRMQAFQPDAILYVVDHRQSEHFDKLFAVLRKIGWSEVELAHVAFGTVLDTEGKPYKTRSGTVVGLEYLLDEAVAAAWKVVCNPERLPVDGTPMSEQEMQQISQVVGIGAIKYADLCHNRTSDYEFDLQKMVQLDGKTSAYIQYSYARTRSLLQRSGVTPSRDWFAGIALRFDEPIERELALHLLRYHDTLSLSMEGYYPSVLAGYVYDLAKLFASFFDQCPVLRAEDEAQKVARLGMVYLVGETLRHGLDLLGIEVVERM